MSDDGTSSLVPHEAPRGLEELYERYTPLLLSAVAALRERGLDVDPGERLALVHDFYLEAAPGVLERYDPSRARFSTYLYAAFLRFARPRVARLNRWKRLLVPLDDAIEYSAAFEEPPVDEREAQGVSDALAVLPKHLREVLEARLVRQLSERQIATVFGLSRYAVRQRLAEALGRIAISIGHVASIRADLQPLAIRLWRDEVPLMRVADECGWSRSDAWKRFRELVRTLTTVATRLSKSRSGM